LAAHSQWLLQAKLSELSKLSDLIQTSQQTAILGSEMSDLTALVARAKPGPDRNGAVELLRSDFDLWSTNYGMLVKASQGANGLQGLDSSFKGALRESEASVTGLRDRVRLVLRNEYADAADVLWMQEHAPAYVRRMQSVTSSLLREQAGRSASYRRLEVGLFSMRLLALLALAFLLIRPLAKRAERSIEHLNDANDELTALNQQLVDQRIELERHRAQLELQVRETEAYAEKLSEQTGELREINESLASSQAVMEATSRRFQHLFHGLPVACCTVGADGVVFEWNEMCRRTFSVAGYQSFTRPIWEVVRPANGPEELKMIVDEVLAGNEVRNREMLHIREDGTRLWTSMSSFPLTDVHNQFVGLIAAFLDISTLKQHEEKIQQQMQALNEYAGEVENAKQELLRANSQLASLATTDGLTGLLNHRAYHDQLEIHCGSARKGVYPVSVLAIDVDHFKAFNDEFGHVAGDEALRQVGALIESCSPGTGIVARPGGEEFALLLPKLQS
jgi:PAS domain S-box-containing protein